MEKPHFFDATMMEWTQHPDFPSIRMKALETRSTHPTARVSLVQIGVGAVIDTHVHEDEAETAYFLAGTGMLKAAGRETALKAGSGVTIPAGLPHSLQNTGDVPIEVIAAHISTTR